MSPPIERLVVRMSSSDGGATKRIVGVVNEVQPSGQGFRLAIVPDGAGVKRPIRVSSDQIVDIADASTGEIVPDVWEWCRRRYVDACIAERGVFRLEDAIDALPIAGIGPAHALAMSHHFGTWAAFCSVIRDGDIEAMVENEIISQRVAEALIEARADPAVHRAIDVFDGDGRITDFISSGGAEALSGKTVAFAGALVRIGRGYAQRAAVACGAHVVGVVSAETELLVAGEGAGRRLRDAQKFGVRIVSEDEFICITGIRPDA